MITINGWYLLSTDALMSWTDATRQWGFKPVPGKSSTYSAYDIIYELSGHPITDDVSLTQDNWRPINITNDISMASPYSAYWVKATINPIETSTIFEDSNNNFLSIYISGDLSPSSYEDDISANNITLTDISSVIIGDSVTFIEGNSFRFTDSMLQYIVNNTNTHYKTEPSSGGVLFNYAMTEIVKYPSGISNQNYDISNSVTSIGIGAFHSSSHLTTITFPGNVTNIGDSAFDNCPNLSTVTFTGSTIPTISTNAFNNSSYITAYYTQAISVNDVGILKAIFPIVIGPDLFTIDSSYDSKYSYIVENGTSSVADKYSIISVNPTDINSDVVEIKINYSDTSYNDYNNYTIGVLLVGPGETPSTPATNSTRSPGGDGGASIYAEISGNDISENIVTLHCASKMPTGSSVYTTSMDISSIGVTWTCDHNLTKTDNNLTYQIIKSSVQGGVGGNDLNLPSSSKGGDSDWSDSIPFVGSSVSLSGYGGGGGTSYNTYPPYYGQAGQAGIGGHSGDSVPTGSFFTPPSTYYKHNAEKAGSGGGGTIPASTGTGWASPGNGGDGLVYFYIGYKAPMGPLPL